MDPAYFDAIERAFCLATGRGVMLSARDVEWVRRWAVAQIPLEVVIDGIDRAFGQRTLRAPTLAYAVPAIEDAMVSWQSRRAFSAPNANGPSLAFAAPTVEGPGVALTDLLRRLSDISAPSPALAQVLDTLRAGVRDVLEQALSNQLDDPTAALNVLAAHIWPAALDALPTDVRASLKDRVDALLEAERRVVSELAFAETHRSQLARATRRYLNWPRLELQGGC